MLGGYASYLRMCDPWLSRFFSWSLIWDSHRRANHFRSSPSVQYNVHRHSRSACKNMVAWTPCESKLCSLSPHSWGRAPISRCSVWRINSVVQWCGLSWFQRITSSKNFSLVSVSFTGSLVEKINMNSSHPLYEPITINISKITIQLSRAFFLLILESYEDGIACTFQYGWYLTARHTVPDHLW